MHTTSLQSFYAAAAFAGLAGMAFVGASALSLLWRQRFQLHDARGLSALVFSDAGDDPSEARTSGPSEIATGVGSTRSGSIAGGAEAGRVRYSLPR